VIVGSFTFFLVENVSTRRLLAFNAYILIAYLDSPWSITPAHVMRMRCAGG